MNSSGRHKHAWWVSQTNSTCTWGEEHCKPVACSPDVTVANCGQRDDRPVDHVKVVLICVDFVSRRNAAECGVRTAVLVSHTRRSAFAPSMRANTPAPAKTYTKAMLPEMINSCNTMRCVTTARQPAIIEHAHTQPWQSRTVPFWLLADPCFWLLPFLHPQLRRRPRCCLDHPVCQRRQR